MKWEYFTEECRVHQLTAMLNRRSEEGWELCQVVADSTQTHFRMFYKRIVIA